MTDKEIEQLADSLVKQGIVAVQMQKDMEKIENDLSSEELDQVVLFMKLHPDYDKMSALMEDKEF